MYSPSCGKENAFTCFVAEPHSFSTCVISIISRSIKFPSLLRNHPPLSDVLDVECDPEGDAAEKGEVGHLETDVLD